jgi:hypothetical protein
MHAPTRTADAFFGSGDVLPVVSELATGPATVAGPLHMPGAGMFVTVGSPEFWRSDRVGFIWWLLVGLYIRKRIGSLATEG